MSRLAVLLRCLATAAALRGPKALAGIVPFGEHLYEIALDAWERYQAAEPDPAGRREAVAEAAALSSGEARAAAGDAASDAPPALTAWLAQVPAAVRRSLRRPADPAGRTLPDGLALDGPEDLLRLLPDRLPRFKAGDRPVGNWELAEPLGVGGFGEVWLARHPYLRGIPPVALKFCLDEDAARVLRHEAHLLDHVMRHGDHPGVVRLRQAYLDADPPCLEYEYVDGGDLSSVARGPAGAVEQAAGLVRQLAGVVGHMHRLSPPVVHRDLKPANVLVRREPDGRLTVKVADFGIGALASAADGTRGANLATALRGSHTPLYASPQQQRGGLPDPRDDVHALGVIWFQLLAGDPAGGLPADWQEELRTLGVPAPHAALLGACVASRPERRPADAAELAERLDALNTDVPVRERARPAALLVRPAVPAPLRDARDTLVRAISDAKAARWLLVPALIPLLGISGAFTLVAVVLTLVALGDRRGNAEPLVVALGFCVPALASFSVFAVLFGIRGWWVAATRGRLIARARETALLLPDAAGIEADLDALARRKSGFASALLGSLVPGFGDEVRQAWDVVRRLDASADQSEVRLLLPESRSFFASEAPFEIAVDGQFVGVGRARQGFDLRVRLAAGEHELALRHPSHTFERRATFRTTTDTREIEWTLLRNELPRLSRVE